jgi:hypothetical protein
MPRGVPTSPEKEAQIIARLLVERHASRAARAEGVSFAKAWRLADRECIELTAGREAKGYWRLSPERRAAVIEARRENPAGTQEEIARAATRRPCGCRRLCAKAGSGTKAAYHVVLHSRVLATG